MSRRWSTIAAFALVVGIAGCDADGEPRELPVPQFDAYAVFSAADSDADGGDRDDGDSNFEDRIGRAMDGGDVDDDQPEPRSVRTIPLGASLVADIPSEQDVWKWSRRGGLTLVSMTPRGELPQFVMVTADYGGIGGGGYSRRMRRFAAEVDPSFDAGIDLSQLVQDVDIEAEDVTDGDRELDVAELLESLMGSAPITGGLGLGYQSRDDSFSGWRWYGQNASDVAIRLGRTDGRWGSQPAAPAGLDASAIESAVGESINTDGALDELRNISDGDGGIDGGRAVPARSGARPAEMYLGSIELGVDRGVHVAILCTSVPRCPVATDVAHMLDGVRSADSASGGRQTDFEEHAEALGLRFE